MAGLPFEDRVGLDPAVRTALEARVSGFETLEDLIGWGPRQDPPVTIDSVVTQDEFTHDVLVPEGHLVLVYDTN